MFAASFVLCAQPGDYMGTCRTCNRQWLDGDKRAIECQECHAERVAKIAARPPLDTREFTATKTLLVIRREDGKFFAAGCDCPGEWVHSPLNATDRSGLLMLRDARLAEEGEIVEVKVQFTTRFTGRIQEDLYEDGRLIERD